uniref:AlNc14C145G7379 protein n=1 Tax=Albugo laibachii Nc14 TaxID=890382 RepID=F0WLJ2_9STRA|nr:AlNc14C145G7379 [Albugo laibachii Nc14]|eukprot:CCA22155.1 AlNc14C145G7379 [Albugo laibachii Nc14]
MSSCNRRGLHRCGSLLRSPSQPHGQICHPLRASVEKQRASPEVDRPDVPSDSGLPRQRRARVGLDVGAHSEGRRGEVHQQEDQDDGDPWIVNAVPKTEDIGISKSLERSSL